MVVIQDTETIELEKHIIAKSGSQANRIYRKFQLMKKSCINDRTNRRRRRTSEEFYEII